MYERKKRNINMLDITGFGVPTTLRRGAAFRNVFFHCSGTLVDRLSNRFFFSGSTGFLACDLPPNVLDDTELGKDDPKSKDSENSQDHYKPGCHDQKNSPCFVACPTL